MEPPHPCTILGVQPAETHHPGWTTVTTFLDLTLGRAASDAQGEMLLGAREAV